ncbi:MAG: hypothetical protein KDK51_06660 [Deltaproteobacteria bacterium]|nr:hypothetical protein [Deltaproteobacteria bacterium]
MKRFFDTILWGLFALLLIQIARANDTTSSKIRVQMTKTRFVFSLYGDGAKIFYTSVTGNPYQQYENEKNKDGAVYETNAKGEKHFTGNRNYSYDGNLLTKDIYSQGYVNNIISCFDKGDQFYCVFAMHKITMNRLVQQALFGTAMTLQNDYTRILKQEEYTLEPLKNNTGIKITLQNPYRNSKDQTQINAVALQDESKLGMTIKRIPLSKERKQYRCEYITCEYEDSEGSLQGDVYLGETIPARRTVNDKKLIEDCVLPADFLNDIEE